MSDTQEEFTPSKPKSKAQSKKQEKKKPKKGGKKQKSKNKEETTKIEKDQKGPKKKKAAKQEQNNDDTKRMVFEYMEKQNRPYNLLNVFDNLHGQIKKPLLESILNQLVDEEKLTAKQFSKNKVYYLNQDSIDVNKQTIDKLGNQHTEIRAQEIQLAQEYKQLMDQHKKLMSRKTLTELKKEIKSGLIQIQELQAKKTRLVSEGATKVEEKEVIKVEKQEEYLSKELKKRKKLTKQCVSMFSQMLQMKVNEVAELIGVQI